MAATQQRRRSRDRRLGLALALFALAGCGEHHPLPSVVLITVDTLRADRLGCYGYFRDTSPELDRLAPDSLLFERAYAPMATTLPVHVSLLTSTHPSRHGIVGNLRYLRQPLTDEAGLRTLAQMLSDLGYTTAAFVASTPLKAGSGIGVGFGRFDQPRGKSRRAEMTVAKATRWLESRPERPFFLWIHFWDPHAPYRAPTTVQGLLAEERPAADAYLRERGFAAPEAAATRRRNLRYDEEIRYVDRNLGALLERLRETGLYDDAAVVVAGDHGEGLGQHDWRGHGVIWNEQLRVPLLIKLPRTLEAHGRRDGPVSLVDVVPTLVDALDLPLSASDRGQLDGRSLLHSTRRERYVLSERSHREVFEGGVRFALTGPRWKYLHLTEGADALYDLNADPHERADVLSQHPELARRLEGMLRERLAYHRSRAADLAGDDLSDDRLNELRSLGYVD